MARWWTPLQETVSRWFEHKDARLGAALAYYSVFSIGPLIVIAIAIAGLVFGGEAVQGQVFGALRGVLGIPERKPSMPCSKAPTGRGRD
jgi:membrane protein